MRVALTRRPSAAAAGVAEASTDFKYWTTPTRRYLRPFVRRRTERARSLPRVIARIRPVSATMRLMKLGRSGAYVAMGLWLVAAALAAPVALGLSGMAHDDEHTMRAAAAESTL